MAKGKAPTKSERELIYRRTIEGASLKSIVEEVRSSSEVTRAAIRAEWIRSKELFARRRRAKRVGSEMMSAFLDSVRSDSAGAQDMAALIETALYRDILQRLSASDGIETMSLETLLKFDISYRRLRMALKKRSDAQTDSGKAPTSIDARAAIEALDLIGSIEGAESLAPDELERRAREKIVEKYGEKEIERIESSERLFEAAREMLIRDRERRVDAREDSSGVVDAP